MNITYQLTLNEYQEAVYFHHKTGRRPLMISIYLGFATFILLVGTDFSNNREIIFNMFTVFFSISFYILFVRMITAYQAKSKYNKSQILSKNVTVHVSGKGINPDKNNNKRMLPWNLFSKWKENNAYYLIYTNMHAFNVIPKRVMTDKDKEDLKEYLDRHIPKN